MKNTELRIGNYLQRVDGSIFSVKRLIKDDDDILVNETQGLFTLGYTALPIPLTEEILLKCGFVKDETDQDKNIISGNICDYILESDDEGNYFLGVNHGENTLYFSWDIKHLHQLQNLYHALTGQELKIEL